MAGLEYIRQWWSWNGCKSQMEDKWSWYVYRWSEFTFGPEMQTKDLSSNADLEVHENGNKFGYSYILCLAGIFVPGKH